MAACEEGVKKRGQTICEALKHPLRVRILEALHDGPRSPSQFVAEGLVPKESYENYNQALSLASCHFRALEREECVEVIESIPRRGAVEHVYKGTADVYFNDSEFEELPQRKRQKLSRISLQSMVARATGRFVKTPLTRDQTAISLGCRCTLTSGAGRKRWTRLPGALAS